MKTFLGFVAGVCIGAIGFTGCMICAMRDDENFTKSVLMMAGYNFKGPSETKEDEAK